MAQGHVFSTYPASEEVQQWVLRGLFEKNLDVLLTEVAEEEYLTGEERSGLSLPGLGDALGVAPSAILVERRGDRPPASRVRRVVLPPARPGSGPLPRNRPEAGARVRAYQRVHPASARGTCPSS